MKNSNMLKTDRIALLNLCGLASLPLSVGIGQDLEGNAKSPRRKDAKKSLHPARL